MNRKEISKRYYESHKHECIVRVKEWEKNNPEKAKETHRKSHDKWLSNPANRAKWNAYLKGYKQAKKAGGKV